MRDLPHCLRRLLIAGFLGSVLVVATGSAGRTQNPVTAPKIEPRVISPENETWKPSSIFEKDEKKKNGKPKELDKQPRMNLSGAACAPTTPKFKSCLIANDETNYAQFFSIKDNTLTPLKLILLSNADEEMDAEGTAYADGFFYVTGSHGRSRKKDEDNKSSYTVVRFPVDVATGLPTFQFDGDKVAPQIQVSVLDRLRNVISQGDGGKNGDLLKKAFNKSLKKENGANVEGIAVRNKRMHLGFRGPAGGFVLSVNAEAVFNDADKLEPQVKLLGLGDAFGIRDLTAVDAGILVLAGPVNEGTDYVVWLWDGVSDNATPLAKLKLAGINEDGKAEILLPLEEDKSNIGVLVMFDSIENGGATSFKIPLTSP
jgi:hypothetical protein